MELYAHIGLYKTGTTTLQKQVFPKLERTHFYGFKESLKQFYELMFIDDLYYKEQKHIDYFKKISYQKPALFSQEALSGYNYLYSPINRSLIANRLYKIGFNKIIITIRNQIKAIESLYRQYIKTGGVLAFEKYFNNEKKIFEKHFSFHQFEYWRLVELYCKLFGKENVCILPIELFTRNKKYYLKKIETFLRDKFEESVYDSNPVHNKGMCNLSLKIMRFSNHFTYNYFKPSNLISNKISSYKIQKILSKTIDPLAFKFGKNNRSLISEDHKDCIFQYYKENNKKLNQYYNLNLQDYNYPL